MRTQDEPCIQTHLVGRQRRHPMASHSMSQRCGPQRRRRGLRLWTFQQTSLLILVAPSLHGLRVQTQVVHRVPKPAVAGGRHSSECRYSDEQASRYSDEQASEASAVNPLQPGASSFKVYRSYAPSNVAISLGIHKFPLSVDSLHSAPSITPCTGNASPFFIVDIVITFVTVVDLCVTVGSARAAGAPR